MGRKDAAGASRNKKKGRNPIRTISAAARSGLKRYPRAILDSIRLGRSEAEHSKAESPLANIERHPFAASWLGHATVLFRVGGLTILTDPVLSHRIGPSVIGRTIGIGRLAPAPVTAAAMPPVDVVLISHAHFDHLDKPTLKRLVDERTTVITARRTGRLIPKGFGKVIEVGWEEEITLKGPDGRVRIATIKPRHWGARAAWDHARGYNSYVLSAAHRRVLFAGDTAYTDAFDGLEGVNLAAIGIGAYEPWEHAHATPEQAWEMFRALRGKHLLPVHHSTFQLGDEAPGEAMSRLLAAAGDDSHRIIRSLPGEVWSG